MRDAPHRPLQVTLTTRTSNGLSVRCVTEVVPLVVSVRALTARRPIPTRWSVPLPPAVVIELPPRIIVIIKGAARIWTPKVTTIEALVLISHVILWGPVIPVPAPVVALVIEAVGLRVVRPVSTVTGRPLVRGRIEKT